MTSKLSKALQECLKKKCKIEESSTTILGDVENIRKRIASSQRVTQKDVSDMRKISDRVKTFKMKSEDVKCRVEKCMKENNALAEHNIKSVVSILQKMLERAAKMSPPEKASEKPKSRKGSEKPKSRKGSEKPKSRKA